MDSAQVNKFFIIFSSILLFRVSFLFLFKKKKWQLLDRGSSLVAFRLCFHHNQLKWPRVDGMLLNPIRLVLISWGWVCNPVWLSRIPFFPFSFYFVGSLVTRGLAYSYRY